MGGVVTAVSRSGTHTFSKSRQAAGRPGQEVAGPDGTPEFGQSLIQAVPCSKCR